MVGTIFPSMQPLCRQTSVISYSFGLNGMPPYLLSLEYLDPETMQEPITSSRMWSS
jgi:hypothetical protein